MADELDIPTAPAATAPVLSTPDTHIFEASGALTSQDSSIRTPEEQLALTYEVQRTVDEIRKDRRNRIALQFPDSMLVDAPRVFQALARGLQDARRHRQREFHTTSAVTSLAQTEQESASKVIDPDVEEKLFILADTSYGACCVDEVAAEHADADVVVHYGRACLSPTARLPVIFVFTKPPLQIGPIAKAFRDTFRDLEEKIILMSDVPYQIHLGAVADRLRHSGYTNLFVTTVLHDTTSPLPNRSVPVELQADPDKLQHYRLFHVSDPPQSLLLTLASRVKSIHICPVSQNAAAQPKPEVVSSTRALNRRYGLITSLNTVAVFGILINTLSVKNYMHIVSHVKSAIAASGKKSYTFVVGKVNAAKVANFSEVGGWVVIGCWESSLFESKDFWKPIITPFELELVLLGDVERVWTGQWTSDFQAVLKSNRKDTGTLKNGRHESESDDRLETNQEGNASNEDSEDESEPPEFDLRTGKYVSQSRPLGRSTRSVKERDPDISKAGSKSVITRARGDLARIGGEVSPAAEFFRTQRSWQGLGSDFEIAYDEDGTAKDTDAAPMEEGRSGIARGYTVGNDNSRT